MCLAAPTWAAKVLVWGDSLSAAYGLRAQEGWVALLATQLGAAHSVVNASQSGETTAGGLSRLPAALQQHRPDVVVLELGANDGLRGLPLDEMRSHLSQMIRLSQTAGARVLLVGMALPPNYGMAYTTAFSRVYADTVRQHRISFAPLLMAGFEADRRYFQADGLHPTAAAQGMMRDTVSKPLLPLLKTR